jgi:hypothetical protein
MSYGKISIKPNTEAAKLITQLGSKNKNESLAAQEAFAAFIGPVIQMVVDQAPVISNLYTTETFLEGTAPSLPLDVYYDIKDRNFINVVTQSIAGGLATSEVKGIDEMFVNVYELDSAISMPKKYAREARLNVVAASMTRMAQEILVKQEINSASILLKAAADARYDSTGNGSLDTPQIIRSATANYFSLDEFNRLITLLARARPSWAGGGTPVDGNPVTHLVLSPEMIEQIRSIAYQPVNTRNGATTTSGASSIAAPESIRAEFFKTAGIPSFFGVELVQAWEYGVGRKYNTLFKKYIGSTTFQGYGGGSATAFDSATEEVVTALALNNNVSLVRLVEQDAGGGTVAVLPDDQFMLRSDKVGFFSKVREGRVILDQRNIGSLVV